jgi:hypothetical protein
VLGSIPSGPITVKTPVNSAFTGVFDLVKMILEKEYLR